MLFNSTLFLFAFLPLALGAFLAMKRRAGPGVLIGWLLAASLLFYAWAQPTFLALLLGSVAVNFGLGIAIQDASDERRRRVWLALGVVTNLAALGVFKYAHFALGSWNQLTGADLALPPIGIPLAISFFTFQQIAYLSDTAAGQVRERRLGHYALFVAFFPKLVAGPIVHHGEMMEQLDALPARRETSRDLAVGLTLFGMGLFKKVVLADGIAGRAAGFFDLAAEGVSLTFLEAWTGAFGFTMQVYFDFSGYSDMALGLARCFGIILPLNFHSPYKATDINEFWRRWHVTLTRWLRLFLFVPISRSFMRRGERWEAPGIAIAQLVTMGLCGLWHGAGWSFLAWGLLHGVLLVLHEAWRTLKSKLGLAGRLPPRVGQPLARLATLATLIVSFVVFRAADLSIAFEMLNAMAELGEAFDARAHARFLTLVGLDGALALTGLLAIVWLAPNSQEILADYEPALDLRRFSRSKIPAALRWRPSAAWASLSVAALLTSIYFILVEGYEEFIYRFF